MNNIKSQLPSFRGLYLAGGNLTEKRYDTAEAINNYTNSQTGVELYVSDGQVIQSKVPATPIPSKIVASKRIDATVSFVDTRNNNEKDSFIKVSIKDVDNNVGIGTIKLTSGPKSLNYIVEDNKGKLFEQSSKPIKNTGEAIVKVIYDVTSRLIQTKAKGVAEKITRNWQTLKSDIISSLSQLEKGNTNPEKSIDTLATNITKVDEHFTEAIKTIQENQGF